MRRRSLQSSQMQDLDPIDQIYQGNLIFSGLDMPERIKPIENNPPNTKANIFFILERSNDMTNEINRNKSSKHESHSCNHGAFSLFHKYHVRWYIQNPYAYRNPPIILQQSSLADLH